MHWLTMICYTISPMSERVLATFMFSIAYHGGGMPQMVNGQTKMDLMRILLSDIIAMVGFYGPVVIIIFHKSSLYESI